MCIYIRCVYILQFILYIYAYATPPQSSIYAFILFGNIECQLADDQRDCGQCDKRDSSNDYVSYSYSFGLLIDQMGYGMRQDVFSSYCHSFCLFIDQIVRGGMRSFGAAIRHQSKVFYVEMQVLGVSNVGNMQTASKSLFKLPSMCMYTYRYQ